MSFAAFRGCLWQDRGGSGGGGGQGGVGEEEEEEGGGCEGEGLATLLPPVSPLSRPGRQAVLGSPAPR